MTAILIGMTGVANANSCLDQIGNYAKTDTMVKAWGIEKDTGNTIIFVQNIRNFKAIDIAFYGFNDKMAKSIEKDFGCKNVSFENAYTDSGVPRF